MVHFYPLVVIPLTFQQGWQKIKHLEDCAGKVAILKSANMSLGINVLMKLLAEADPVSGSGPVISGESGAVTTGLLNRLLPQDRMRRTVPESPVCGFLRDPSAPSAR